MNKPSVVIIDTNNSLYRMFSTRPPYSKNGHRIESLQAILNEANSFKYGKDGLPVPDRVISIFDHNGRNFRNDLSSIYKANRKGMPEELKSQEEVAIKALRAQGIPVICKEGYEADDSMGMVANYYAGLGYHVYMVTTDKDMHQLVTDNINILNPISKKIFTPEETFKKFGVHPKNIADLLAIMGDKSDNIIGLDGVGQKTAAKWINYYGDIKSIQKNAENVKGLGANTLKKFKETLTLSHELTLISSEPSSLYQEELDELKTRSISPGDMVELRISYGIAFDGDIDKKSVPVPKPKPKAKKEPAKKEEIRPEFEQGSLF